MFRIGSLAAVIAVLLSQWAASVDAQVIPLYLDASTYERLGLEEVWSTQIQMDAGQSDVAGVRLQVVGVDSYESLQSTSQNIYEVTYGDRIRRFGENDLNAAGLPHGRAEAERLAEKFVIQLKARGIDAKLSVRQTPLVLMYVQSSRGGLHALNAETGATLWSIGVGSPRQPALRPAANDRYVAAVSGSKLYLLNRLTGETIWDRELGLNPIFGAAISSTHVFVPSARGHLEAYSLPDENSDHATTPPWIYHSGSRITAMPLVTSHTLSWPTIQGLMFVADVAGPTLLYRHQTGAPIWGEAVQLPPSSLLVSSSDGYLSAINEMDGEIAWSFTTGDEIEAGPLLSGARIYQATKPGELFCIGAEQGEERWVIKGVKQILSVGVDRVYVLDMQQRIVAIDGETGRRLASMPAAAYDEPLTNGVTDRMYLMSHDGALQCLREIGAAFPTIARPLPISPEEEAKAQAAESDDGTDESMDAGDDLNDDPFAEDGGFGDEPTDDAGDDFLGDEPAMDDEPVEDESGDALEDDPFSFDPS